MAIEKILPSIYFLTFDKTSNGGKRALVMTSYPVDLDYRAFQDNQAAKRTVAKINVYTIKKQRDLLRED